VIGRCGAYGKRVVELDETAAPALSPEGGSELLTTNICARAASRESHRAVRMPRRAQPEISQLSSNPRVIESQFAWGDLLPDMLPDLQEKILEHTATSFAVESYYPIQLRFSEVGWTEVPYVARYEFKLMPRNLSTSPKIEFTLTRVLDPAFMQSRLFLESEVCTQEMLVKNFMFEETFSLLSAVRLEMRSESVGIFRFVQTGAHGEEHLFRTPFWSRVERNTIEEVREKLETMFHVELD